MFSAISSETTRRDILYRARVFWKQARRPSFFCSNLVDFVQENADLLTEEGMLLQQIQGENVVDYDIDAYASRLSQILDRKVRLATGVGAD